MGRHRKDAVVLLPGLGPHECSVCGAKPPYGPLPYGWKVLFRRDAAYVKGYRLPLTCPDHEGEYDG